MHDITWYWNKIRKQSCYSKAVIIYENNVVLNRTQLSRSSFCLISLKRIELIKDQMVFEKNYLLVETCQT